MSLKESLPTTNNQLEQAKQIKRRLDALNIGYGNLEGFGMPVAPEPFKISEENIEKIRKQGQAIVELFRGANLLYWQSLTNPNLFWVRKIIEGQAPPEVVEVQRQIFTRIKTEEKLEEFLPFFFRLDQTSIAANTIEFESWGSGMGFQLAVQQVMRPGSPNLAAEITRRFKEKTNKECPKVVFIQHNPNQARQSLYFVKCCREHGINMEHVVGEIPSLDKVDAIKRPRLVTLLQMKGGRRLIEKWMAGEIIIEPPPNIIYDEKVTIAWPFHPKTKSFFPETVREALIPTTLIADDTNMDGVSWNEVFKLSTSERQIVVKYGGNHPRLRGNARAVYEISGSRKEAAEVIHQALGFFRHFVNPVGPWVAQKRDKTKFEVTFLANGEITTEKRYSRFNPAFIIEKKGEALLMNFTVNFGRFWKVAGGEDVATLAVEF